MPDTNQDIPATALLAGLAGGLSAVPLIALTVVVVSYAPELDGVELWSWPVLLALGVAHLVGAHRLTRRRGRRLQVGAAAATLVGYPLLVVASSAGQSEPVGDTVQALAFVLAGPLMAVLLGCSAGARRWAAGPADEAPG